MYDFVQDLTIEQRQAILSRRSTVRSKVDGNIFTQAQLDAMKNLSLDLIHMIIDEPQVNADDREYALSLDLTNMTKQYNLSASATVDGYPSYYPTGTTILFVRSNQIWTMDKDGYVQTLLLSAAPLSLSYPRMSRDGASMVYCKNINTTNTYNNIFLYDFASGMSSQLTNTATITYYAPRISPDGNTIAFHSDEFGTKQIFTMDISGANKVRLVNRASADEWPAWSSDGTKLLFSGPGVGGTSTDIWSVNADGTNITKITNTTYNEKQPVYSPNGLRIAFVSDQYPPGEVMTMKIDGTDVLRITNNTYADAFPRYSPNGVMLVSERNSQVYVMPADGVPVYPEFRHEYFMANSPTYHNAWAYDNVPEFKELADASSDLYKSVVYGRRDFTYREYNDVIVDRSLLRNNYRPLRTNETPPADIVGRRAPPPGA